MPIDAPTPTPAPTPDEVASLSYAAAGAELDAIIGEFEAGVVDVDRLVEQLERATVIVDELDRRLRRTRLRVDELVPRLEAIGEDDRFDDDVEPDAEEEQVTAGGEPEAPGLF